MPKDRIIERFNTIDGTKNEKIDMIIQPSDLVSLDIAEDCLVFGRSQFLIGEYSNAEELFNNALFYFKDHDEFLHLFYTYSNLGYVYRDIENFDLALLYFKKAYEISYELEDFEYTIIALNNLGSSYSDHQMHDKALEYLDKGLGYLDKIPIGKTQGDLYNNYAYVLIDSHDYEKGLEFLLKASEAYKKFYKDDFHINIVTVNINLGELYCKLKQYDKALDYTHRALKDAERLNLRIHKMQGHQILSLIYEALDNYNQAYSELKTYIEIKEEVSEINKNREMKALEEAFKKQEEIKEEEIHLLRNVELKNKTIELERTLASISQISHIGQRLTASMDLDEIYNILKKAVAKEFTVNLFGIATYHQDKNIIIFDHYEENHVNITTQVVSIDQEGSLAAYCIRNNTDIFIKNYKEEGHKYFKDARFLPIGEDDSISTQCIIYCRLLTEQGCIGVLTLQTYEPYTYKSSDFEIVKALASYVAIAISNAQKKNIINEKAKELEFLSYRDPLTGLYNRRKFNQISNELIAKRHGNIGLIMGDMNNLKYINDNYGHKIGDEYLIAISEIMTTCSANNSVFRLGGDEFAILVEDADENILSEMIECIEESCQAYIKTYSPLSIALGYEIMKKDDQDISLVFSKAESKMYYEKNRYHQRRH